ncbi:MAG: hypothetical protein WBP12_00105 [Candidatus Saccharimonas sp.]
MQNNYWTQFAANYDCNAYGTGDYNNDICATTSTNGGLSNTGEAFIPALAGGILLIVIAAAVLFRMLYKKRKAKV